MKNLLQLFNWLYNYKKIINKFFFAVLLVKISHYLYHLDLYLFFFHIIFLFSLLSIENLILYLPLPKMYNSWVNPQSAYEQVEQQSTNCFDQAMQSTAAPDYRARSFLTGFSLLSPYVNQNLNLSDHIISNYESLPNHVQAKIISHNSPEGQRFRTFKELNDF